MSNRLRVTWTLQSRPSDSPKQESGDYANCGQHKEETHRGAHTHWIVKYPSANATLPLSEALNFIIPLLD